MNNNTKEVKTKACSKCGIEKPLSSEFFYKDKRRNEGFRSDCKKCSNKRKKDYYTDNKEKILKRNKKYRDENKELMSEINKKYYNENKKQLLESQKEYYGKNKDEIIDYQKSYYKENIDYVLNRQTKYYKSNKEQRKSYERERYKENKKHKLKYAKLYREENKELIRGRQRKYYQENKNVFIQSRQRYDARKKNLPHTLTIEQWDNVKLHFNNSCSYCGMAATKHVEMFNEALHQDHFISLNNGGEYTHNNIIPACRNCNSSKQDKDFFEWYPTHESYSKQRKNKILKFLNYETNKTQQLSIL